MAIDISTDLVISLLAKDYLTPTITGVYDSGQPAGTYIPGKDFSATDDVSIGNSVVYNISIAFDSLSNQHYTLDQVYIQSVDDPRTDGMGNILGRWINQDPNPQNITDDGQNTPVSTNSYFSKMTSIVFDQAANIKSLSTITTSISVALPSSFLWKTKIMPKIQVVAVKDGIKKVSGPLQLATVRLSSAANLVSTLSQNGNISYTTTNGNKGFIIPFRANTQKQNITNITPLADNPIFNIVTYEIDLGFTAQGSPISLATSNFSFGTVQNGEIQSYSYSSGKLTVVVKQTASRDSISFNATAFAPFDGTGLQQAQVTLTGNWAVNPPVITDFQNKYLFTESATGSLSFNGLVDVEKVNPGDQINMRENINFYGKLEGISHSLTIDNYGCIKTQGSQFIRYIDSKLAYFSENITPSYSYFDTNVGSLVVNTFLPSEYTLLYGYYNFVSGAYDPNLIGSDIVAGDIGLKSYAEIIADGHKPNILSFTINTNLFAAGNINTNQPYTFSFNGELTQISQAEFRNYYNSNPQSSYPNTVYSYMHLNTCYVSIADAMTAVGTLLSPYDTFTQNGGNIYLNLGTLTPPPLIITRFNNNNNKPVDVYNYNALVSKLVLGLYDGAWKAISTVNDYTKEYCLGLKTNNELGVGQVNSTIDNNTVVTLQIPPALVPYIYVSGIPKIETRSFGLIITTPITDYLIVGDTIVLTMPKQTVIAPDRICIPVRFLIPSQTFSTTAGQLSYSEPLYYSDDPNSLLYGFDTTTQMFNVLYQFNSFQLLGAQQDTTGLTVAPTVYNRGEAVTYVATVDNLSFNPTSNYYLAITVPTNEYNPVKTSDNTLDGFITAIDPKNPGTVVYFQTATNATAQDIAVMGKQPNTGTSIKDYYNNTIVNTWQLYTPGMTLPSDVVMFVGYVPNIAKDSFARIDYKVVMQIPPASESLYVNDAVFNYFSTGSSQESQSNMVQIRNRIAEAIPIQKYYNNEIQPLLNGTKIPFEGYFIAPADTVNFKEFTVIDKLHESLTFDAANTAVYVYPNTPVAFTPNFDVSTNTVSINIKNTAQTAGKTIRVVLGTILKDTLLVPEYNMIENTMDLIVNSNPLLKSTSNVVQVRFQPQPIDKPIPITKYPATQTLPLENGTPVVFTAEFQTAEDYRSVQGYNLTDTLHQSLTVNLSKCVIKVGEIVVSDAMIGYDDTSKMLFIYFMSKPEFSGQKAVITIYCTLQDYTKVPESNIISNEIYLDPGTPSLISKSNTVYVNFFKANPIPITKAPLSQTKPLVNGTPVLFTATFDASSDTDNYKEFTVFDKLHESLSFDKINTKVMTSDNQSVSFIFAVDTTNTVAISFINNAVTAGKKITVTIATVVSDITKVPSNLIIENSVDLVINYDMTTKTTSNNVEVIFEQQKPVPVPITKSPASQTKPYANGTLVNFDLMFTAPTDLALYKKFTIIDKLHGSLGINSGSPTVTVNGNPIPFGLGYDPNTNELIITIVNTTETAGKVVTISISTTVIDITKIPSSLIITNQATILVNDDQTIKSDSNVVQVVFKKVVPPTPCEQAITDIIESVALEQTAISHILNAEGEKIQKAVALNLTHEELLKINKSVTSMVNSVSMLEMVLQGKLQIFEDKLCDK